MNIRFYFLLFLLIVGSACVRTNDNEEEKGDPVEDNTPGQWTTPQLFFCSVFPLDIFEDVISVSYSADKKRLGIGFKEIDMFDKKYISSFYTESLRQRIGELDDLIVQDQINFSPTFLYGWVSGEVKLYADGPFAGREAGENLIDLFSIPSLRYRFSPDNLIITAEYPKDITIPFLEYYTEETLLLYPGETGISLILMENDLSLWDANFSIILPVTGYDQNWGLINRTFHGGYDWSVQ